jgi:hypothetical protein
MKYSKWIFGTVVGCFALTATLALADGHGQEKAKDTISRRMKMKAKTTAMKAAGTTNTIPKITIAKPHAAGTTSTRAICHLG